MRFEIRYFFLEIEGLNRISRKKYLISSLIIYFCFPRACMLQYIVRAPLYSAWNSMLECVQQYIRVCATVLNISSCWSILIDVDPFWGGVPCGDFNRKIPSSARIGVFKARRKGGRSVYSYWFALRIGQILFLLMATLFLLCYFWHIDKVTKMNSIDFRSKYDSLSWGWDIDKIEWLVALFRLSRAFWGGQG